MTETKHIFGPNGHVAKVIGGTKYYYHSDHLGSLRQETDEAGNALWSSPAQYEPFGEMRSGGPEKDGYFYTGKLRDTSTGLYYYIARFYDPSIGRFITADSHTDHPDDERLREKGQFIERQMASLAKQISKQENGFMFTKSNYKNIVVPTEISIRNIIVQEWSFNPQNANRYAYVRNNPMLYIDPSGHDGGACNSLRGVAPAGPPGKFTIGGAIIAGGFVAACITGGPIGCAIAGVIMSGEVIYGYETGDESQEPPESPPGTCEPDLTGDNPMDDPLPIKGPNKPIPI